MTTVLSMSGVSGSDGVVPVYNPDGRWQTWALKEIYNGNIGANRYVPNVDDYVIDTVTDERYIVLSIDPTTIIPVLKKITPLNVGSFSDTDILLGVGPGTQSDTYRVYVDKSVRPFTMAVDARLRVAGSMVTTAKIFKGSDLADNLTVVSAFYDQTGNLLGQAIPLELVSMSNDQNFSIRTVPVCYTSENLLDGEIVTAVFYSNSGHVVSKRQLLVENTAFIRSNNVSVKYIISISLETPFLSQSDPKLIQYPLNVPLRGLSLIGVVHYNDGTSLKMPVDGTKFSMFGFEQYAATIIGQKVPLVLKYSLSVNEIVYGSTVAEGKFITESYRATTVKANGAYTIKLFGYPVWIDAVNGYRIEWFLYTLERNKVYNVTPFITFNSNTVVFNPTSYGITQRLSVSLNMRDVNGTFVKYIHVQSIDISLLRPGTDRLTNWTIGFDPSQNPPFGRDNFASTTVINQNLSKLSVGMGALTIDDWLNRLYWYTKPLTDDTQEVVAPTPDFYSININGIDTEFPISQWNTEHIINTVIPDNSTLFIKFFRRTVDFDIQLAICGIPTYQTN